MVDLKKLQNGSDIRGVAVPGVEGEEANLLRAEATALARGFMEVLRGKCMKTNDQLVVAVGCDSRVSGPFLKRIILETFEENGLTATDCGLASTPAMFMATQFDEFNCDGAIMVTASHLPYNRNGFKFFDKAGGFQKTDIANIIDNACKYYSPAIGDADKEEMLTEVEKVRGVISHGACLEGAAYRLSPLMERYAAHLRDTIVSGVGFGLDWTVGITDKDVDNNVLSGLNICVDAGNGAGGFYASHVLAPLGANISTSQFLEPDGAFPNHVPNPENKEAMASITAAVKGGNVDLGIIFDTDVDRSAAVTSSGREVARNGIVALAAILVAEDYPGSTIVTDSITSNELHDFLEGKLGLKHLRYKRGYKNVINKAQELEAAGETCPLAIETSGHAALKENYFLDDGAFLATKIVIKAAQLKQEGLTLDDLLSDLKEPLEAREFRMNITREDFAPYGDKILNDLTSWVESCGDEASSNASSCCDNGNSADDCCTGNTENNCRGGGPALDMSLEEPNYEGVRINFFETVDNTDSAKGKFLGWALLRKSLHDPVMPMNIESDEEGGVSKIKEALRPFLSKYKDLDSSVL